MNQTNEEKEKVASAEKEIGEEEQKAEEAAPAAKEPAEEKKEKTKHKKEKKNEELEKLKEELQKQKDVLLRTVAEYDNYRKRTEREKRAIYNDATAAAVEALLPVADNVERAVAASQDAGEEFLKGLSMIANQLSASLQKLGVTAFGEAGEAFNPDMHNAVAHIDDESMEENVIAEVFQKGYSIGDKVIRHAMVKVAN